MSRNTKIFLVIFTVFLIGLTAFAIKYKKTDKTREESHVIIDNSQKTPEIINKDLGNLATKGATLSDTYATNGLKYRIEKTEEKGIDVNLVQISGLKNTEVQKEINDGIKQRITQILGSNNFKKNSDESASVDTEVEANFSDVLSIKITVKFTENFKKNYGLNYRLDTGEKLKINDLFIYNAPKRNIITEAAYRTFAMNYYTEEGIGNEFYKNIEGEVLSFLVDYNNDKITEFTFDNYNIKLYRDGKTVNINMLDYYPYIDIYSIFASSSNLYEETKYIVKDIPIFMVRPKDILFDLYEKANDTCILDIIIYTEENLTSEEKEVVDNYRKELITRLSGVKQEKNVYYSNYIKVVKSKENDEPVLRFEEYECYAVSEEGKFLETIYDVIMRAERNVENINYGNGRRSKIYFLDEEMLQSTVGEVIYSIETGKEYVEPEPEPEPEETENTTNETSNEVDNTVNNTTNTTNTVPTATPSPSPSPTPRPPQPSPSPTGTVETRVTF